MPQGETEMTKKKENEKNSSESQLPKALTFNIAHQNGEVPHG